jgi:hypothetical protein
VSNTQPVEMSLRLTAALDYVAAGDASDVRDHFLWLVKQMMADMVPEDLTTEELVTTVVAWSPAHSRAISSREPSDGESATILQLVPNDSVALDDFKASRS